MDNPFTIPSASPLDDSHSHDIEQEIESSAADHTKPITPSLCGNQSGNSSAKAQANADTNNSRGIRASHRMTLILRSAKLIVDGREHLCILRDISSGGVGIRLFHPIASHQSLALELYDGAPHPVQLVWEEGFRAGLRFKASVNIDNFLQNPNNNPIRDLRFNHSHQVNLTIDGVRGAAHMKNISSKGAMIETQIPLQRDRILHFQSPYFPARNAQLRWTDRDHCGLMFMEAIPLAIFAQSLQELHKMRIN